MKNEIIEEAKKVYQKALQDNIELSFYDGVNLGAEFQQERMYSESEAKTIWRAGQEYWKTSGKSITFEELIEQFKKK
jgi:hypothetical protein